MIMHVLAGDEDKVIQPSYGWLDGCLYRCLSDLSAHGTEQWSIATHPHDAERPVAEVTDWTPCGHPQLETRQ